MSDPRVFHPPDIPYRDMTAAEVRTFVMEVQRRAANCWMNREAALKRPGNAETAYGFKLEAGTHEEDLWILRCVLEGRNAERSFKS